MRLIVDHDMVIHKAAANCVFEFEGQTVIDYELGVRQLHERLEELQDTSFADSLVLCQSCSGPIFRHMIYPWYKSNRQPRTELITYLRAYSVERLGAIEVPLFEADDLVGMLSGGDGCVWSEDKDLLQIPGDHFSLTEGIFTLSPEEADYHLYYQVLVGDSVDTYPGCPGVGPVLAKKILRCDPRDYWDAVIMAYESRGLTEQDAIIQARVSYILRAEDYKRIGGKLEWNTKLWWTPPSRRIPTLNWQRLRSLSSKTSMKSSQP